MSDTSQIRINNKLYPIVAGKIQVPSPIEAEQARAYIKSTGLPYSVVMVPPRKLQPLTEEEALAEARKRKEQFALKQQQKRQPGGAYTGEVVPTVRPAPAHTNFIQRREMLVDFRKAVHKLGSESPSPWTTGEETIEEALVAPLMIAINNIDEGKLDQAKGHIQSVIDIIKLQKVASRFEFILKFAGDPLEQETSPATPLSALPKISLEESLAEAEDQIIFALFAIKSGVGFIEKDPAKAKHFILLAVNALQKESERLFQQSKKRRKFAELSVDSPLEDWYYIVSYKWIEPTWGADSSGGSWAQFETKGPFRANNWKANFEFEWMSNNLKLNNVKYIVKKLKWDGNNWKMETENKYNQKAS
jgi:hypothetical protein